MATQTTPYGLSETELKQLQRLLDKANAANAHGPAIQIGEPYVALINLSVPRREPLRGEKDVPQTDLVMAGDTLYLTPEEAERFNRHDPNKDGRRIPVVRKLHGPESSSEPPGKVHPSYLSGPIFRPPAPQPGSTGPRPDPAGSSQILVTNPVPEAAPAQPGSENTDRIVDAMDIPPGGSAAAAHIQANADQDIVAAARAQMKGKG